MPTVSAQLYSDVDIGILGTHHKTVLKRFLSALVASHVGGEVAQMELTMSQFPITFSLVS